MKENNTGSNKRPEHRNYRPNNQKRSGHYNQNINSHNILPSPRVLESYEEISPGAVNKMLEMAKKEQEHRHIWQDKYLKFHNVSHRAGLIFGAIYNIGLLFLVFNLVKQDNKGLALKLFLINALLIAFAIIVTAVERKITTRKPPRRTFPNKDNQNSEKPKNQHSLKENERK